ncbi:MAG TPA: hypothetical protein VLW85_12630 [Myxococcales bacterium]|nr:hypothetical protein [Myxococcales bacterium]
MRRLLLALLLAAGCSSNSPGAPPDGGDGGQSDAGDAGPTWSTPATLDSNSGAGFDLAATVDPSGKPAVAYFRQDANSFDATCNQTLGCPQFALVVARETSPGTWTTEDVPASLTGGDLNGHYGVSLAFDNQGNPAVVYMGGDTSQNDPEFSDNRWKDFATGAPLPSDWVVARKSGSTWSKTTLATSSDSIVSDAAQIGSQVDDNGPVVGLWAGIVFDADGTFHGVHRDVHFAADFSAFTDSNLEYGHFSASNAKLAGEMVGSNRYPSGQLIAGAGTYTSLVLAGGQPAVSFALGPNQPNDSTQVWFAKRTGANAWTRTQVSNVTGRVGHGPSLAYSASQGFAIGFLDATQGDLLVATSSDGLTWGTPNTIEALGETGYHPAAAWSGSTLGILYAYCHDPVYSGSDPCDPTSRQLRFRVPGSDGPTGAWNDPEKVDSDVPEATAMVTDSSGKFVAIWRAPGGTVKFSRRTP